MKIASPLQNDHYFIKVLIDPSNYFVREGLDLHTEADISISQALLGGQLKIRGLYDSEVIITKHSIVLNCDQFVLMLMGLSCIKMFYSINSGFDV